MLPKVIPGGKNVSVQAPAWRVLTPAAAAPPPAIAPEEIADLKASLARALDELCEARKKNAELEDLLPKSAADAFERGRVEGAEAAQLRADADRAALLERISLSVAEIASLRGRIRQDSEKDLVKLAMAMARRITHRELSVDPEALAGVVRSALAKTEPRDLTKIMVHPSAAPTIRLQLERLRLPASILVEPDASLQAGDVLLEMTGGVLDASIDTQLREIERGFCDRLEC